MLTGMTHRTITLSSDTVTVGWFTTVRGMCQCSIWIGLISCYKDGSCNSWINSIFVVHVHWIKKMTSIARIDSFGISSLISVELQTYEIPSSALLPQSTSHYIAAKVINNSLWITLHAVYLYIVHWLSNVHPQHFHNFLRQCILQSLSSNNHILSCMH